MGRMNIRKPGTGNQGSFRKNRGRLLLFLSAFIVFNIGCSPLTVLSLLIFPEQKYPADFDLTTGKEKVKIAILTFTAQTETRPELLYIHKELNDAVVRQLRKSFKDNGNDVTIVDPYKIREYKANNYDWEVQSPQKIGKHFGADYVINLEIREISLYEYKSRNTLYRGKAEIGVSVTDVNMNEYEGPVFTKNYIRTYPESRGPIPADSKSVGIFRADFVNRMARELSFYFADYPTDARHDFD